MRWEIWDLFQLNGEKIDNSNELNFEKCKLKIGIQN